MVRQSLGRHEQTTFLMVDAPSVKHTDTAEPKGLDGGQRVSGIQRHRGVDTNGLPHALYLTTAKRADTAGALARFNACQDSLSRVITVLVEGGSTGEPVAAAVMETLGATVASAKRSDLHTVPGIPKRGVVERSFAGLEKCRRLWKNGEPQLNSSLQRLVLAFLSLVLKRSETGS